MKRLIITFSFLSFLSLQSQTTMEEAKILLEEDYQVLFDKGYGYKNLTEISGACEKDNERVCDITEIYRPGQKISCATLFVYYRKDVGNQFRYIIPAPNTNYEVLSYIYSNWWKKTAGQESMSRVLMYSLVKYSTHLKKNGTTK
jgi:hypothetical protein